MQWWRVVGAIGRFMMRAGAVILLFVAYQLWGTGLSTARAQDRLTREFEQQIAAASVPSTSTPSTTEASTISPPSTAAPVTAPADLPVPELGDPLGRITIPAIDSDFIFVQGVDLKWLKDGPGHFPQTPLPGQPGNAAIAGHRTTYAAPFNRLDELRPGDPITITTAQGTFTYLVDPHQSASGTVSGHVIVGPDDVSILAQGTVNRLTLMACHPKFSAAQRIVVTATLGSPPAPATPIPVYDGTVTTDASADSLAGGDPEAWLPSLLWGYATILVWFGVWFAARRWRKVPMWAAYLVGTPVVLLLLFLTFENVARLLPASY